MKNTLLILSNAAVICFALILSGCAPKSDIKAADNTITVKTIEAKRGDLETEATYIGVIENAEQVEVVNQVGGNVTEVNVSVGDRISEGSVLCRFDDTSARLDLESAKVGVASAQKSLANAQNSLANAQTAYNAKVADGVNTLSAQHEYNDYQSQADICALEADIRAQEAKIQEYKDTTIHDAEKDIKKYKKRKRNAETDEEKKEYDSKLSSAETSLTNAEQNLMDMESKLKGMYIDYQTAVEKRELNNGDLYQNQQIAVANTLQLAQNDINSAVIGIENASVGVESAENKVDAAQYQLSLYTITAPMAGVIEEVNVEKDNYLGAGNVSFVISSPNSRRAVFHVTDTVASELSIGQSVTVKSGSKEYEGFISEIGVGADETGLFLVKATFAKAANLADGINIKVSLVVHKSDEKLMVPTDAVYFKDNQAFVYVLKDGRAVRKDVELDIYGEEDTTILTGIRYGDRVITSWSGALKDGAEVVDENGGRVSDEENNAKRESQGGQESQGGEVIQENGAGADSPEGMDSLERLERLDLMNSRTFSSPELSE